MRIASIISVEKKVHESRIECLKKYIPEFNFDIYVAGRNKINVNKYDVIFYSFFDLYNKQPLVHKKILTSITSHKCLENYKKTLSFLRKFNRISVNNRILFNIFNKDIPVFYLPNGVDLEVFRPKYSKIFNSNSIKIGWVGNIDRSTKNFCIINKLRRNLPKNIEIRTIETKKSTKYKYKIDDMVRFYQSLDFYMVTSSTEGTPNPALEAAACGVPIISTRVGNMVDLIRDGTNGFFVNKPQYDYFSKMINFISKSIFDYDFLRSSIINDINEWSWKKMSENYRSFFE